jgi:hypothetical protein
MKNIFVSVNGRHFGTKISRQIPPLPHACAKKHKSRQIFVSETTPKTCAAIGRGGD